MAQRRDRGRYSADREWADRFIPQIRKIIGGYLIGVASYKQDTEQATDLISQSLGAQKILRVTEDLRVAIRIRSHETYSSRYGDQITFRLHRDTGAKTEWAKVVREGQGHWFWYGFGTEDGQIDRWHLVDLDGFRDHHDSFKYVDKENHGPDGKPDGTYFRAFWVHEFGYWPATLIGAKCDDCDNKDQCMTCGRWRNHALSWPCSMDKDCDFITDSQDKFNRLSWTDVKMNLRQKRTAEIFSK